MRTLSANATTEIAKSHGIEPIVIVDIEWIEGTEFQYADRDVSNIPGKILEISNLDQVANINKNSVSISIDITLSDEDGELKALLDAHDIHKRPCIVYQYFDGLALSDRFEIFRGEISSQIEWDEGKRTFSFTVLSKIEDNEVGFAPEEGQYAFVTKDEIGKVWPLCFGSVAHVPATKAAGVQEGTVGTFFGFSDPTLPLKKRFLENRRDDLIESFLYLATLTDILNASTKAPEQEQCDFIDLLTEEDTSRQLREDLSLTVDKLNRQLDTALLLYTEATDNDKKEEARVDLLEIRDIRDQLAEDLLRETELLVELDKEKQAHEILVENMKYIHDFIGEIRKFQRKILREYIQTLSDIDDVNENIVGQSILDKNLAYIIGGRDFDQNVLQNLIVNDQVITGAFSEDVLAIQSAGAKYVNIATTPQLTELDEFAVLDTSIDLTNMFCKLPNGHIIKVTSHEGFLCKFQIIQIPRFNRNRLTKIDFDDISVDSIKRNLSSYLNGDEDDAILIQLLNTVPRTLSKFIWKKIFGSSDSQIIKSLNFNDDTVGTWKIAYDGEWTQELPVNATAGDINLALSALPSLQKPGGGWIFDVEDGQLNQGITVRFQDPLDMQPFLVDDSNLSGEVDDQGKPKGKRPRIIIEYETGGPRVYTKREREQIEEEAIAKSTNGPQLQALIQKMEDLKKAQKEAPDGDTRKKIDALYEQTLEKYNKLLANTYIADGEKDDAITDKEFDLLHELQILHYLQWRRSLDPIDRDVRDENDRSKYFVTSTDVTQILEASPHILPKWLDNPIYDNDLNVLSLPASTPFIANVGDRIAKFGDYQEKYVCNILPSTIKSVYGYRIIDGIRRFVPVPSRYYVKNETENFGRFTGTTITLQKPLSVIRDQDWEDGIYVSLISSQGPNTADIIKWITETFTSVSVDNTSYTAVKTALANYPSNFCLLDKRPAFKLLSDIAFQARCAVWIKADTLYMKYLSTENATVSSITESDILFESMKLTFTPTEDLVTKLVAKWKATGVQEEENQVIVRHNVAKYGEQEEEYDFFIYNIEDLVIKSATFWSIMKSNTWKILECKTPLTKLALEAFDDVSINIDHLTDESVTSEIELGDYDSADNSMIFRIRLPVRIGEMTKYEFAFPADLSIDVLYPSVGDIQTGNAGNPIGSGVPTINLAYSPLDPNTLEFRPNDYGDINPSDLNDALPADPLANLSEEDYHELETGESKEVTEDDDLDEQEEPKSNVAAKDRVQSRVSKSTAMAIGRNGGYFVGFGRIIEDITQSTENLGGTDEVGPRELPTATTKEDYYITDQTYKVRLSDGREVEVRQLQIDKDERLPINAAVLVVFDPVKVEFQMQVPVWLPEFVSEQTLNTEIT